MCFNKCNEYCKSILLILEQKSILDQIYLVFARLNPSCITGVYWEKSRDYKGMMH